ncbi:MAG: hypothetical protein PHY59_00415 [Methanobacterium sp.]|nr:hypothetical protein [Methanobacterium sp.]
MKDYKEDINSAKPKYGDIEPFVTVWMVQVQNHNGKNMGSIYVNAENGDIFKTLKAEPSNQDIISNTNSTTSNTTDSTPQTNNNNWIIIAIIIIIIGIFGIGYLFYIKK